MVFEGAEVARADGVVTRLTNQVNQGENSLQGLMSAVVLVVAVVVAGVAVVKAVSCIGKKDYKQAAIFGAGALACFILAFVFATNVFRDTAHEAVGDGDDLATVLF